MNEKKTGIAILVSYRIRQKIPQRTDGSTSYMHQRNNRKKKDLSIMSIHIPSKKALKNGRKK